VFSSSALAMKAPRVKKRIGAGRWEERTPGLWIGLMLKVTHPSVAGAGTVRPSKKSSNFSTRLGKLSLQLLPNFMFLKTIRINVRIVFKGLWRASKNSICSIAASSLPKRLVSVIFAT
jgi:hypothetical protein